MVILDNECKMGTCIIYDGQKYIIKPRDEVKERIQGIGGVTEDNILIGLYLEGEKVYFLCDKNRLEITIDRFNCENKYISKIKREFVVKEGEFVIYKKIYEPFIDPGMLWYDADPEEYDFLLRFYNILKNKEAIEKIISWIKQGL